MLLDVCIKIKSTMKVLGIEGLGEDVKESSSSLGLSFYDSAYFAVAIKHNLQLVTDNKKSQKAAKS